MSMQLLLPTYSICAESSHYLNCVHDSDCGSFECRLLVDWFGLIFRRVVSICCIGNVRGWIRKMCI